jgi:hypothetical protein
MKKIILIVLICISVLSLISCDEVSNNTDNASTGERFVCIYTDKYNNYEVLVDTETNVQYIRESRPDACEWIMLVDENGKPLLYEQGE